MKRTTSPFNCNSIGQSLKRVKISTSPGELRLEKDLEILNQNQWTCCSSQNNNYVPVQPSPWRSNAISTSRSNGELCHKNARLVRDPVDPLRLRLTCLHQPFSQSLFERWTFMIQIPRMYPHLPPLITRVTRELISNENMAHISNISNGSASTFIVASSVMQASEPPEVEQILIRSPPPPRNKYDAVNTELHNNIHNRHHDNSKFLSIDEATAVYNSWSPVSTLGDLLDFLIAIPTKRREWWAVESNRLRHQEQLRLMRVGHRGGIDHNTVSDFAMMSSMSNNENIEVTTMGYSCQQLQHQVSSSSRGAGESDDDLVEHMMVDSSVHEPAVIGNATADAEKLRTFPANRFDLGYDRTPSTQHWDIMQR